MAAGTEPVSENEAGAEPDAIKLRRAEAAVAIGDKSAAETEPPISRSVAIAGLAAADEWLAAATCMPGGNVNCSGARPMATMTSVPMTRASPTP
jgi:hypothetical protein